MAFEYGFYNSINGDRKYNALDFGKVFDGVIRDGVFADIGDKMFVTRGAGSFEILVGTGKAWFDHTWNLNTSPMLFTLSGSHPVLTRYDAVVLEVNETQDVYGRVNEIKVIEGTPSSNPVKPALLNTDNLHQHPLAYVKINPEVTEIASQDIEIVVGQTDCPFVTSILQQTDITELFANWNGQFNTWFDNLKAQLTDNVVTNLQNQIDQCFTSDDIATADDIKAGTPGKLVSAENFKAGVFNANYKVGDIIKTYRKGIGPEWALCNGSRFDKNEYPELASLMPNDIKDKFGSPYNRLVPIITPPIETGPTNTIIVGSNDSNSCDWPKNIANPSVSDAPPIIGDHYILFIVGTEFSVKSGSSVTTSSVSTILALNRDTMEQKMCPVDRPYTDYFRSNFNFREYGLYIKERGEFAIVSGNTAIIVKESDIENSITPYRFTATMFTLPASAIGSNYNGAGDITYQNGFLYYLTQNSTKQVGFYISKIDLDNKAVVRIGEVTPGLVTPVGFTKNLFINDAWFCEDKVLVLTTNQNYASVAPSGAPPFDYLYFSVVSYLYGVSAIQYPIYIDDGFNDKNGANSSRLLRLRDKFYLYVYMKSNATNSVGHYAQYIFSNLPASPITVHGNTGAPPNFFLNSTNRYLNAFAINETYVFGRSNMDQTIICIPISGIDNPAGNAKPITLLVPTDYADVFGARYTEIVLNWFSNAQTNNLSNIDISSVASMCYDKKFEEFIYYGASFKSRINDTTSKILYGIYIVSRYSLPCITSDGLYSYIKIKDG